MGVYQRIATKTWMMRSKIFLAHMRFRLKNKRFSIISNNCVGGVIYHNLNAEFMSPTINLWMKPEDFIRFAGDLPYYLNCPIQQVFEDGITYPIGRMKKGADIVTIYFMHYKSFEEAVEKWQLRSRRVNMENLYCILDYPASQDSEEQQRTLQRSFEALPMIHKKMLTKDAVLIGKDIVNLSFYDTKHEPGFILKRKNDYTVKRYLDDFDYVAFLNQKDKEIRKTKNM